MLRTLLLSGKSSMRSEKNLQNWYSDAGLQDFLHKCTALDPRFKTLPHLEPACQQKICEDLVTEVLSRAEQVCIDFTLLRMFSYFYNNFSHVLTWTVEVATHLLLLFFFSYHFVLQDETRETTEASPSTSSQATSFPVAAQFEAASSPPPKKSAMAELFSPLFRTEQSNQPDWK